MAYNADPEASIVCSANCLLDDSYCSIALWRDNTCYLGDWNVDSQIFSVSTTKAEVRRRKCFSTLWLASLWFEPHLNYHAAMLALIHGGSTQISWDSSMDDFDDLHLENGKSCPKGDVLPSGLDYRGGHALLFVAPWLMICGGRRTSWSSDLGVYTTLTVNTVTCLNHCHYRHV